MPGLKNDGFNAYYDIATKSGGAIIDLSADKFIKDFSSDSSLVNILHQDVVKEHKITVNIDGNISKVMFIINSKEPNDIQVLSPQGTALTLENLNNNIKILTNNSSCFIEFNNPIILGDWQILSINQQLFNVNVSANTDIIFLGMTLLKKEFGRHGWDFFSKTRY